MGSTSEYLREFLILFDFAGLDKLMFFDFDALEQYACRLIVGILRNELALHCHLEYGVF